MHYALQFLFTINIFTYLQQGEVTCRPVPCLNLSCKNPVYTEGECCPICLSKN